MLDLALHALQIAALVWLYREVRRLRRRPTPAAPGAQEVIDRLVCSGQISTVESDTPLRGPDRCVQFGNGWGVRARL